MVEKIFKIRTHTHTHTHITHEVCYYIHFVGRVRNTYQIPFFHQIELIHPVLKLSHAHNTKSLPMYFLLIPQFMNARD